MRLYEVVAGLIIIVVVVAMIRLQYGKVERAVTDPDQSQYRVIPAVTPVLSPLCSNPKNACVIPTLAPIFSPTPRPGLRVP